MADFEDEFKGFGDTIENGTISGLSGKNSGKRILVLFIVDATRSMEGQAIGQVNYALAELFSDLKNFASDHMLNMDLAIMSFSNSIKWEMKPEDIQNCFAVPQIHVRPGQTQYGVVYHELNKMLNKNHLLRSSGKQAAPVLVFLTDGAPNDEYMYDLDELKKNGYFMLANRSAVIMGEGANNPKARAAAAEFTMDENMVLTTDKTSEIVNAIKLATLHTLKGTELNVPPAPVPEPVPDPVPDPVPGGDPFDLPPSGDPADLPPTGNPFEIPPSGDPADLPPTGNPFEIPPSGEPADLPLAGNPFDLPPSGEPADIPPTGDPFDLPPTGDPFENLPGGKSDRTHPKADLNLQEENAAGSPFDGDPFADLNHFEQ